MNDHQQTETPMSDHVRRFWETLKTEHVRLLIDIRREHDEYEDDAERYHWDSASFSDKVAKALVADISRLTAERDEYRAQVDALNGDVWKLGTERDGLRKALEEARGEIVLAISFLGRDAYTDRINATAMSVQMRLLEADLKARNTLATPTVTDADGGPDGKAAD